MSNKIKVTNFTTTHSTLPKRINIACLMVVDLLTDYQVSFVLVSLLLLITNIFRQFYIFTYLSPSAIASEQVEYSPRKPLKPRLRVVGGGGLTMDCPTHLDVRTQPVDKFLCKFKWQRADPQPLQVLDVGHLFKQ